MACDRETVELRYLRLRAQGKGDREAARLAGYASSAPSRVVKLAAKIPDLRRERATICPALDRELDQINRQIAALLKRLDDKRQILKLCAVLDEVT